MLKQECKESERFIIQPKNLSKTGVLKARLDGERKRLSTLQTFYWKPQVELNQDFMEERFPPTLRPFNLRKGDREAAGEGDRWEGSLGLRESGF